MNTPYNPPPRRPAFKRATVDPLSPSKATNLKRPRSPESGSLSRQPKRVKPATTSHAATGSLQFLRPLGGQKPSTQPLKEKAKIPPSTRVVEKHSQKDAKRIEKDEQNKEFLTKYSAAFPRWTFYFDKDNLVGENLKPLQAGIHALKGEINTAFFEKDAFTHLITNCPLVPAPQDGQEVAEKENGRLRSPFKLRSSGDRLLLDRALSFGKKVWNIEKLRSVLKRCGAIESPRPTYISPKPSQPPPLRKLLKAEKIDGTSERDPTQRRHDYTYFGKGSYWVLVEDIKKELAPILVKDYGPSKDPDGQKTKPPWPRLYCDHRSRHPFHPFDQKEQKRYEKSQGLQPKVAKDKELLRDRFVRAAKKHAEREAPGVDLRRTVSLSNMSRRALEDDETVDLEADSTCASGFLASGNNYVAASGNSVGITSTTGTTSTSISSRFNSLELPASLRGRKEVITSRKHRSASLAGGGDMGPPSFIPEKTNAMLKKSRSTNTVRLDKREEGMKPGYCENCRMKFKDFDEHAQCSKHRAFAANSNNWMKLDLVLQRVVRRTNAEVQEEERKRAIQRRRLLEPEYSPFRDELDSMTDLDDFGRYLQS